MNFGIVQCFIAVAKLGSFTEASEMLFLTQSAISKQIMRLEDELGTPLFVRANRSIELTDAGRTFLRHAERLTEDYLDAVADMEEHHPTNRRSFTVCIEAGTSPYGIPDFICDYFTKKPELKGLMRERPSEAIRNQLETQNVDVVLTWGVSSLSDSYIVTPILKDSSVLIVKPGHPLSERVSMNMKEIGDTPFALMTRDVTQPYFDAFSKVGFRPNVIFDVCRTESLMRLAAAGRAAALVLGERAMSWQGDPLSIIGVPDAPNYVLSSIIHRRNKTKRTCEFLTALTAYLEAQSFSHASVLTKKRG